MVAPNHGRSTTKLHIDPEFHRLLVPPTEHARASLTEQIKTFGCRDAIITWHGYIADGYVRFDICNKLRIPFRTQEIDLPDREAVKAWIVQHHLARRHLSRYQECEAVIRVHYRRLLALAKARQNAGKKLPAESPEGEVRKQLAVLAGVGETTMGYAITIYQGADKDQINRLYAQTTTIHHIYNEIKLTREINRRQNDRRNAPPDHVDGLTNGDFRQSKIRNGSLSLILTDPLYTISAENLRTLDDLGRFAFDKLENGGSLICYIGHITLPFAIKAFEAAGLRYYWTFAAHRNKRGRVGSIAKNGGSTYRLNILWRPILWFVKGSLLPTSYLDDYLDISPAPEKDDHEYQQPCIEAEFFIDKLMPSDPQAIVCDPCVGSGTVPRAAKRLGRRWIGYEINTGTANQAATRIRSEHRCKLYKPGLACKDDCLFLPVDLLTTMMPRKAAQ